VEETNMVKLNQSISEMRQIEVAHLRSKLQIAVEALEEIKDVARISEGVEFYAMLAEKALARIEMGD
jgi:hypothetical protein